MQNQSFSLPLLTDHHSHPLLYAAFQQGVDLSEITVSDQACSLLSDAGKNTTIAVGHGWKDSYFEFDERSFESLPPAAVFNLSLHRLLVNREGRKVLSELFGRQVTQIDNPDWYERNLRVVLNWFALLNGSADALVRFYQQLETMGVWSVEEMLLVAEQEIHFFEDAGLIDRTRFWAAPESYAQLSPVAQSKVSGIKLFTDGALGARTAAISRPYVDDRNGENCGMLIYSDASLGQTITAAAEYKKALAIHAIGDRAIDQVLNVLESLGQSLRNFSEIRIEHAQLISREQAFRAKKIGVKLSMQPNFTIDSVDYLDRLGPEFASQNNPFRMLIHEVGFEPGVDLLLGSDGMPHGPVYALQQSLFPPYETQRLSLEEIRKGYCDRSAKPERQFSIQSNVVSSSPRPRIADA